MKTIKTNVMRILDQHKISYNSYSYVDSQAISGIDVARSLNQDENQVFKTLVTISQNKVNYVFLVPVCKELNLKKAASVVSEKNIIMIKSKDLLSLTGYVHGGCSPVGMKKQFKTVIDSSALNYDTIIFSGGKIGYQVEVTLDDLNKIVPFVLGDITD